MRSRFLVLVAAAAAVAWVGLVPGRAAAHDLQTKVKILPDAVVVEAWFEGNEPAGEAKVTITDAAGAANAAVAEGQTDERGVCRFPRLPPGQYLAVVESIGHRSKIEFAVEASPASVVEFSQWRLDKSLGLALGVGGLLAASGAYWWLRMRK